MSEIAVAKGKYLKISPRKASCLSIDASIGTSNGTSYRSARYMCPFANCPDAKKLTISSEKRISILVARMKRPRARRMPTFLPIIWNTGSFSEYLKRR
jgi:hypothetical protein